MAENAVQGTDDPGEQPPATGEPLGDAGKAALEAERAARREAEKQRKALERELEQVRTASLSEAEKAVAEAEKRGEQNALGRVGRRLVDAELRAALTGRTLTPDALLRFDRSEFLTDDFDVDATKLTKWVEEYSQPTAPEPTRFGGIDQGVRTTPPAADAGERDTARRLFGAPT